MNGSIFSDQLLTSLYKYYDVENSEDLAFFDLYESLSDWLIAIYKNRNSIEKHVIRSNKMQNFTLIKKEEKKFTLVWDVSFWNYYTYFLLAFFSFDCLLDCDTTDNKNVNIWLANTESFFCSCILNFLSERFSRDAEMVALCSKLKTNYNNRTALCVREGTKEAIDSIVLISKEFVLMHELEHILFHIAPEIYSKDTKTFDDVLRYYEVLIDRIDENTTHIKAVDFKTIVNDVLLNKDKNSYSELYGDFHAFFEVLLHHGENFSNMNCPFTQKVPDYLFAIKLLKIFESCLNYATEIVDCLLSTRFQEKAHRLKRVVKTSYAYQKTIFNRDYLSVELFSVCLMLYSEGFLLDREKFAASIDTVPFVLPYTKKMQPIFNELVQELVNEFLFKSKPFVFDEG